MQCARVDHPTDVVGNNDANDGNFIPNAEDQEKSHVGDAELCCDKQLWFKLGRVPAEFEREGGAHCSHPLFLRSSVRCLYMCMQAFRRDGCANATILQMPNILR